MYEHLLKTLPESVHACRALYDTDSGGYHLPLRADNRPPRLRDVAAWRAEFRQVHYDCIEPTVADLLYALIVNTRSRLVLETGTSRGFSTCHLAAGVCFEGAEGRVVTIDPAPAPNPFFGGTPLAQRIVPMRTDSLTLDLSTALDGERFDFMFFDSLHTYAHLSRELAHFLPLLKVGGLFALHDTLVYDDLGLVVLWMMRSGCAEVVTLPSHRRHEQKIRSPGVTLFRKVTPVEPGQLLFPDLDDIVSGERQCVEHPERIVARTGSLFTDARYAAGDLHRAGPRNSYSPALLDPGEHEASEEGVSAVLAQRLSAMAARWR